MMSGKELSVRQKAVVRKRMATIRFRSCGAGDGVRVLLSGLYGLGRGGKVDELSRLELETCRLREIEQSAGTEGLVSLQELPCGGMGFEVLHRSRCGRGTRDPSSRRAALQYSRPK